ncbi:cell adhesion molecule Dscam2-like [Ornithodoros turicata]|uniref:cell adhesion molecule Dscam2-like n=1 Tax=Ornithodoros turicata TaxID=34597 RepID=UPI00313942E5
MTGIAVKLFCNVQKGSKPLTFVWTKDDHVVKNGVTSLEDFSTLTMDPVTTDSGGNYTCIVSNSVGSDRYTSKLEVKEPPRWITEPVDVSAVEGEDPHIQCVAAGMPKPLVTWSRCVLPEASRDKCEDSGQRKVIDTQEGILKFSEIKRQHESAYACSVHNGIGKGLLKVIRVRVNGSFITQLFRREGDYLALQLNNDKFWK